jgi:hypothetical protein
MTGRNIAALEQTMQYIKDHPEQHNQEVYFQQTECGTAACFAGWTCILAGHELIKDDVGLVWCLCRNDEPIWIVTVAQNILGLTRDEAAKLFYCDNSIETLELMVKDLVNGDELRWRTTNGWRTTNEMFG